MAPSPHALGTVNLRKIPLFLGITHHFLTLHPISMCFFVYYLSPLLVKVIDFISTYTQDQEIIHKIVADYRIIRSRAHCFLTSFSAASKDSMGHSELLTGAIFYSHRGMCSVSLRPQSS